MANHPENGDLPKYPTTNVEEYLAKLALDNGADLDTNIPGSHPQNGDLPEYPTTNVEEYLAWFTMNGLGKPTLGYFYEGKFYKDPEHTEEIAPKEGNLYFDANSGLMYIYVNDEFSLVGSKLYDTTGDNTDGAMTQKATTDEVDRLDTRIDNIELSSDVVDVVATKADLDAYPTAGLKDKDIIKVLADETKEQATSYYRWNKAGSAWVFMASVGPYYTKRETDAALNGKVDKVTGKQLSTEDYTTAEKTKLAGLENYDDTEIKGDIADLETDKQDVLTAGDNITIENSVISADIDDFTGATSSVAGEAGLVPAPTAADAGKFLKGDGTWAEAGGGGGAAAWGNIGGNIEDQTDLQEVLGNKQNGLVVSGHTLYIDPLNPSSIVISPTSVEFQKGQTKQLTVTVLPEEASDKRYTLESSNRNIVTVDETGLLTCVGEGDVTITATTVAGGLTATCAVTAIPLITYGSVTYYDPADLQIVFDEEYKDGMEIVDQNKFLDAAKVAMGGVPFNTMSQWGEYMRLNVDYDSYMGGLRMYFEGGSSYGEWSGAPEDAGISINEGSEWAYGMWYLSDIIKGQRKTTRLSSQAELIQLTATLIDSGYGDRVVDMDYQTTIGSDRFAYGYITNFDFGTMPASYTYPDNFLCTDRLESVTHEGNIINVGNNFLAQLRTNAEYGGSSWNCNCSFTNIVNIGDNFMAGRSGEFPDVFNATRIGNNFCGRGNMMEGGSFYGTFSGIFRNLTSLGTGFMEGYYPQRYSYIDLSFPVLETIPAGFMMYIEDYSGSLGGFYVSLGGVKTITSPFMLYINRLDYLEIGPNWSAYDTSSRYGDAGICGSWNHIYVNDFIVHSTTIPSLPSSLDERYCWTLDGTISGEGADAFMSVYPNGEYRNLWKNEY